MSDGRRRRPPAADLRARPQAPLHDARSGARTPAPAPERLPPMAPVVPRRAAPAPPPPRAATPAARRELGAAIPSASALPYRGKRAPARARLVALGESGLCIELQPGSNSVGRQQSNHIVLVSGQISRNHADLVVTEDGVELIDLDSNNGTYVNGRRVQRARLQAGDVVMFAQQFALRVQLDIPAPTLTSSLRRGVADVQPFERDSSVAERVPPSLAQEMERSGASEALRAVDRPSEPICIAKRSSVVIEVPLLETAQPIDPRQRRKSVPSVPALDDLRHPRRPTESALSTVSDVAVPRQLIERRDEEEREQRLAVLYELNQRCAEATTLEELDAMLVNVLERVLAFDRGFLLYQLPTGDWRLTTSKAQRWPQQLVRDLMQTALAAVGLVVVGDSRRDPRLGSGQGAGDARVLVPLGWSEHPIGLLFLSGELSSERGPAGPARREAGPFDSAATSFLGLFADIAAQAIVGCVSRLYPI